MHYEPCHALGGRPNVMVDGAPVTGTVLTLSHWPASPTPVPLRADLSAQIALEWNRQRARWPAVTAEVATVDHLDQDGVVSLHVLVAPEHAGTWARRLVEVARAGDFAAFSDRGAARVSFALATLADADRSPLPPGTFAGSYGERTAAVATELLGRLPELVEHPDRHLGLWAEEDAAFAEAAEAVARGQVGIEEVPDLDLAVVSVPEGRPPALATRFMGRADAACHPAAVHNLTDCLRVLVTQGRSHQLLYRYESWVRYTSRPVAPRVDLGQLAAAFQAEERNGARWAADGVAALVPRLGAGPGEETSISPRRARALVEAHFAPAGRPAPPGRAATTGRAGGPPR